MHKLLRSLIINQWKSVVSISKCEEYVFTREKMWRNGSVGKFSGVIHKVIHTRAASASQMSKVKEAKMDSRSLEKRLSVVRETSEDIQALSRWCLQHKNHHHSIIHAWSRAVRKCEYMLLNFFGVNYWMDGHGSGWHVCVSELVPVVLLEIRMYQA